MSSITNDHSACIGIKKFMQWEQIKNKSAGNTWLITGGAGFIGSHISKVLADFGARIVILDNLSTGKKSNISELLSKDNVEFIEGDIRSEADCERAARGVDFVLHQAALASVIQSTERPAETFEVNVQGFVNILTQAKKHNVKRVVYASSSAVYGDFSELPIPEDSPLAPISIYGLTKKMNEEIASNFFHVFKLDSVGLRYFNVFGPGQSANNAYSAVVAKWLARGKEPAETIVYGDGHQTRDFVYVKNIVYANLLAALSTDASAPGAVFNVGSGNKTSILSLLESIGKVTGLHFEPNFAQARHCDIRHSVANINRAKSVFGYEPIVDLPKGLQETFSWYQN